MTRNTVESLVFILEHHFTIRLNLISLLSESQQQAHALQQPFSASVGPRSAAQCVTVSATLKRLDGTQIKLDYFCFVFTSYNSYVFSYRCIYVFIDSKEILK